MMIEWFYFACLVWSVVLNILIRRGTIEGIDVVGGVILTIMMLAASYFLTPVLPEAIGADFKAITMTIAVIFIFIGPFISNHVGPEFEKPEGENHV